MSISCSIRRCQPKWRIVSEYQHRNFIRLSDIYPSISPFTTMLNVRVDMGKLHCGIQMQQWNNGIVKVLCKNVRHKDATIFQYVYCVSLSISNVLTVIFSVESFCRNCKKIDI